MTQQTPPPGWYPNTQGHLQWWDGASWGPLAPEPETHVSAPEQPTSTAPRTRRELREQGLMQQERGASIPSNPVSRNEVARATKPMYWSNLARIRFWQFTLFGSFAIVLIPALFIPVWVVILPLYIIVFLFLCRFWLRQQMACNACGKLLATTKVSGPVQVCARCGTPTDSALTSQ